MRNLPVALAFTAMLLAACSLVPSPGQTTVRLAWKRDAARGVVALDDVKDCLFLSALSSNTQNTFSSESLEGLDPSLIGADGVVLGPYTSTQLASGVNISVPTAETRLRILGVEGPNCATNTFAQNFPRAAVAGLYLVGETTADLATKSSISITGAIAADAHNLIGNSTRTIAGDRRLHLPAYKIFRGKAGNPNSAVVDYNSGTANYGGSQPFEIPFANFLNVEKRISYVDMGNVELHERFDILFSTGNKSVPELNAGYTGLRVQVKGYTQRRAASGAICSNAPLGSPEVLFETALYSLGSWGNSAVSVDTTDGHGIATLNLSLPASPYYWSAFVVGNGAGEPASIRVSLRTRSFVSTTNCTGFVINEATAWFYE